MFIYIFEKLFLNNWFSTPLFSGALGMTNVEKSFYRI